MALAFHILAHREPGQVARLLKAIWYPENTYVIHYDRRRPRAEQAAVRALASNRANVFIQKPRPVLWGRFSLYAAQHEGLKVALASGRSWTHWINLSGQCYPLISAQRLVQDAAAAGDRSFIRHFAPLQGGDWPNPAGRLSGFFLDSATLEWWLRLPGLGRRLRRLFGGESSLPRLPGVRRALPKDFTWYGGDNWVVLSREAAEYLAGSVEAAKIISALKRSAFPEESIFQSAVLNSALAPKVVNDHRRKIKWKTGLASPGLFSLEDWPELEAASRQGSWFARKFASQPEILDKIDAHLLA